MCRVFCLFKQKTAYEMRISDWSSDVCSSDLWHGATHRRSTSLPLTSTVSEDDNDDWKLDRGRRAGGSRALAGPRTGHRARRAPAKAHGGSGNAVAARSVRPSRSSDVEPSRFPHRPLHVTCHEALATFFHPELAQLHSPRPP